MKNEKSLQQLEQELKALKQQVKKEKAKQKKVEQVDVGDGWFVDKRNPNELAYVHKQTHFNVYYYQLTIEQVTSNEGHLLQTGIGSYREITGASAMVDTSSSVLHKQDFRARFSPSSRLVIITRLGGPSESLIDFINKEKDNVNEWSLIMYIEGQWIAAHHEEVSIFRPKE